MKIIEKSTNLDVDEFLGRPLYAFLATDSTTGPCCSPVWFLWESNAIWIIGVKNDSFPKRITEQPLCAISIVDWNQISGMSQHMGLRGKGNLEPFDVRRAELLLTKYLGPDKSKWNKRFIHFQSDPENVFIRFMPESVVLRDQSY